jgi:hypothetical protein
MRAKRDPNEIKREDAPMNRPKILTLALLCALAQPSWAGNPINGSKDINPDGRLEVHNVRGSVQIRTWDKNEVDVRGTLGEGSQFELSGSGADVMVRIKNSDEGRNWSWWGSSGPREDTNLEIRVPKGVSPEVHVVSAEVDIAGLDGSRNVNVESVSGDVRLDARADRYDLKSVSGDLRCTGGAAKRARMESVSGDITAENLAGEIGVETVSGDAHFGAGTITELKMNSVSGDMSASGALAPRGRIKAETLSGDVRIELSGDVSASIDAETFSGDIRSDYGTVETEEHGPGERLRAKAGNGDGEIELKSFSGTLSLRRR